jgi:hypothetical protein
MRYYEAACGTMLIVDADLVLPNRPIRVGSHGYAYFFDGHTTQLLHRWILGIAPGIGQAVMADHINGDPLDNRRANLRIVDGTTSNLNRSVKGRCVYPTRQGRWRAKVQHRGETYCLGTFDTPEEGDAAVAAFREERGIVHDRFSRL